MTDVEVSAKLAAEAASKDAIEAAAIMATRQENIMGEIRALTLAVNTVSAAIRDLDVCFDRFKTGIGERLHEVEGFIGKPQFSLDVLETKVGTILWILQGIAAPILGAIGLALIGFLGWQFIKK